MYWSSQGYHFFTRFCLPGFLPFSFGYMTQSCRTSEDAIRARASEEAVGAEREVEVEAAVVGGAGWTMVGGGLCPVRRQSSIHRADLRNRPAIVLVLLLSLVLLVLVLLVCGRG